MRAVQDTDVRTIRLRYEAAYEAYHTLKSGAGTPPSLSSGVKVFSNATANARRAYHEFIKRSAFLVRKFCGARPPSRSTAFKQLRCAVYAA
jgi:hypothetical protein